jgi:hypothetical protein
MIARKQTFTGATISLDGSSFSECEFNRCTLIFSGFLPVMLQSNSFSNCKWEFAGAAQNTLAFMTALYEGGASDLIEATFDKIRGKANPAAAITKH